MKTNIKKLIAGTIAIFGFFFLVSNVFAVGAPIMSTQSATNISTTSVTLSGFYNDNGSPMTKIFFEYGESPTGFNTRTSEGTITGSSGNYSVSLYGLKPNTKYYFSAVGINDINISWGKTLNFTTGLAEKPVASTSSATDITENSAVLKGTFNPKGLPTDVYFEYGTSSSSLNNSTPIRGNAFFPSAENKFYTVSPEKISNLSPETIYYFRLVAENNLGKHEGRILTFTTKGSPYTPPEEDACEIDYFRASDEDIVYGERVTLSWSTSNCSTVTITSSVDNISNSFNTSGSFKVYPQIETTYTLYATGFNGSDTERITIDVDRRNPNPNPNPNPPQSQCYISYFTADKVNVSANSPVVLSWRVLNCSNVSLDGIANNLNSTGNLTVYPKTTTVYNLRASDYYRNDIRAVVITVGNGGSQTVKKPYAVTTYVSSLKTKSAILNGTIYNSGGSSSSAYFEFGTKPTLGGTTSKYTIRDSSSTYSRTITGLAPDTVYYFRLVAVNSAGTSYGDTLYFRTPKYDSTNSTPVVSNYTKGTSDSGDGATNIQDQNNLGASVGSLKSILPKSIVGWLLLIAIVMVLILIFKPNRQPQPYYYQQPYQTQPPTQSQYYR